MCRCLHRLHRTGRGIGTPREWRPAGVRVKSWRGTKPREVTGLGRRKRCIGTTDSLVEQRLVGALPVPRTSSEGRRAGWRGRVRRGGAHSLTVVDPAKCFTAQRPSSRWSRGAHAASSDGVCRRTRFAEEAPRQHLGGLGSGHVGRSARAVNPRQAAGMSTHCPQPRNRLPSAGGPAAEPSLSSFATARHHCSPRSFSRRRRGNPAGIGARTATVFGSLWGSPRTHPRSAA